MAKQGKKDDWFCKSCKDPGEKPFKNFGFRNACLKCSISKSSCFGGKALPQQPAQRTLAARQAQAQRLAERKKTTEKAEADKLRKELDRTRKELAKVKQDGPAEPSQDTEAKELGLKEKLSKLEERKRCLETLGDFPEELAKVQEEIKELYASRDSTVPESQQFKKAENNLAKAQRQSQSIKAAVTELEEQLEEARRKDVELDQKLVLARAEMEKARQRIAVPKASLPGVSWADMAMGQQDFLKMLRPDLLEKHGLGAGAQQQLTDLMAKLTEAQKMAEEERAAAEAEAAKKAAEAAKRLAEEAQAQKPPSSVDTVAATLGHVHSPGQQHALAHAEAAKPAIVNDDVLMGMCEGTDRELAEAARLILDSEVVAKRRKLGVA